MARSKATIHNYQFTKGLVTDASPLSFPENTCSDVSNIVFDTDGSASVRKGLALEANYNSATEITSALSTTDIAGAAWVRWDRALPGLDVFVCKVGHYLYFRTIAPTGVFTSTSIVKSVSLSPVGSHTLSDVASSTVCFAPTAGYLVVTGKYMQPCYITLDDTTYNPTVHSVTIYERDFEGFDDGLEPAERPAVLSAEHLYNLINRGWTENKINRFKNGGKGYPANTDLVNLGYYDNPTTGIEAWSASPIYGNDSGTSFAPEGSIIFNTFESEQFDPTLIGRNKTYIKAVVADPASGEVGFAVAATPLVAGMTINSVAGAFTYYKDNGLGSHTVENYQVDSIGPHTISSVEELYSADGARYNATLEEGDFIIWTTTTLPGYLSKNYPTATEDSVVHSIASGTLAYVEYNSGSTSNSLQRAAEDYRFEQCAVFAGRIWYAGCDSSRIGNRLYYSQVFEGPLKFGYCYQEADPTSREISELIATDGGVIVLNDMGKCVALVPYQNYLVVFTTNGVWAVFGRDGIFDATQYGVRKVSNEVIVNPKAAVATSSGVVYWSSSSVSVIVDDPTAGTLVSKSITDGVLRNFVNGYVAADWPYIRACSDEQSRVVAFLLTNGKALILDFRIGSFYVFDGMYTANSAIPLGFFYQHEANDPDERLKLLVGTRTGLTDYSVAMHCFTNSTNYTDYDDSVGTSDPFSAYLVTGHTTGGDGARHKSVSYVHPYMDMVTDSSCYVSARWDYSSTAASGKWSNTQQCYKSKAEFGTSVRKLLLRGSGRTLQLKFENEPGKPMKLLGWDIEIEQEAGV